MRKPLYSVPVPSFSSCFSQICFNFQIFCTKKRKSAEQRQTSTSVKLYIFAIVIICQNEAKKLYAISTNFFFVLKTFHVCQSCVFFQISLYLTVHLTQSSVLDEVLSSLSICNHFNVLLTFQQTKWNQTCLKFYLACPEHLI